VNGRKRNSDERRRRRCSHSRDHVTQRATQFERRILAIDRRSRSASSNTIVSPITPISPAALAALQIDPAAVSPRDAGESGGLFRSILKRTQRFDLGLTVPRGP
jgi:hypothetical protein